MEALGSELAPGHGDPCKLLTDRTIKYEGRCYSLTMMVYFRRLRATRLGLGSFQARLEEESPLA